MNVIRHYGPAIVVAVAILVAMLVSSSSFPEAPVRGYAVDKVIHFFLFGTLTILTLRGHFRNNPLPHKKSFFLVVTFCTLYGLLLETVQFYLPERDFSWLDLAADGLGSSLAAWGFWASVKFRS